MRGKHLDFHIKDAEGGPETGRFSFATLPEQCAGAKGQGQRETSLRLLIGCAKVKISVDGLWEEGVGV
jgi:hypothetical protein